MTQAIRQHMKGILYPGVAQGGEGIMTFYTKAASIIATDRLHLTSILNHLSEYVHGRKLEGLEMHYTATLPAMIDDGEVTMDEAMATFLAGFWDERSKP